MVNPENKNNEIIKHIQNDVLNVVNDVDSGVNDIDNGVNEKNKNDMKDIKKNVNEDKHVQIYVI